MIKKHANAAAVAKAADIAAAVAKAESDAAERRVYLK
jgi:hypothetical protein